MLKLADGSPLERIEVLTHPKGKVEMVYCRGSDGRFSVAELHIDERRRFDRLEAESGGRFEQVKVVARPRLTVEEDRGVQDQLSRIIKGRTPTRFAPYPLQPGALFTGCWANDGDWLLAPSYFSRRILRVDPATRLVKDAYPIEPFEKLRFTRGGGRVFLAAPGLGELREVETGELVRRLPDNTRGGNHELALSDDGVLVAARTDEGRTGYTEVWTLEPLRRLYQGNDAIRVASTGEYYAIFRPDRTTVCWLDGTTIELPVPENWHVPVYWQSGPVVFPQGVLAYAVGNTFEFQDCRTGRWIGNTPDLGTDHLRDYVATPDGRWLLAECGNPALPRVVRIDTQSPERVEACGVALSEGTVFFEFFSPHGTKLVLRLREDGKDTLRVLDTTTWMLT
jgi:hypothetical protein